jgi:ribonuclease BN (tRNA processing enzyme)
MELAATSGGPAAEGVLTLVRRAALAALAALAVTSQARAACPGAFAVEVLGSGGPIMDSARASASYIVWRGGKAVLLIDAGGGAFLRFAEAGGDFRTLEAILISHFHADHVADLPAILKSGSFARGDATLAIAGPSGNPYFPGLRDFLRALFAADRGAFKYLSSYVDGAAALDEIEIDAKGETLTRVAEKDGVIVDAIPVNHGDVPALAFRVSLAEKSVIFAGDQSLFSDAFDAAFEGSAPDLLIAHHAISGAPGQPRGLHRDPNSIGDMAAALNAKRLVLSHNMKRALDDWPAGRAAIRKSYRGKVTIANDHACFIVAK